MVWQPRASLDMPRLAGLWRKSDEELAAAIQGTALTRAGVKGLRRNLAVALGNSGDAAALALEALNAGLKPCATGAGATDATGPGHERPGDGSRADPVVADHIEWAVRKLKGALAGDPAIFPGS
jgi:hypothetical protein